jgi:hypothetical protein
MKAPNTTPQIPSRDDHGTTTCPVCRRVFTPTGRQAPIAAPPAARPRSAAATSNPARRSPSRPPGPAGNSPSTNAPAAVNDSWANNAAKPAGTFTRRIGVGGPLPTMR